MTFRLASLIVLFTASATAHADTFYHPLEPKDMQSGGYSESKVSATLTRVTFSMPGARSQDLAFAAKFRAIESCKERGFTLTRLFDTENTVENSFSVLAACLKSAHGLAIGAGLVTGDDGKPAIVINEITAGSVNEKVLLANDVILAVNEQRVTSIAELSNALDLAPQKNKLALKVVREKVVTTVTARATDITPAVAAEDKLVLDAMCRVNELAARPLCASRPPAPKEPGVCVATSEFKGPMFVMEAHDDASPDGYTVRFAQKEGELLAAITSDGKTKTYRKIITGADVRSSVYLPVIDAARLTVDTVAQMTLYGFVIEWVNMGIVELKDATGKVIGRSAFVMKITDALTCGPAKPYKDAPINVSIPSAPTLPARQPPRLTFREPVTLAPDGNSILAEGCIDCADSYKHAELDVIHLDGTHRRLLRVEGGSIRASIAVFADGTIAALYDNGKVYLYKLDGTLKGTVQLPVRADVFEASTVWQGMRVAIAVDKQLFVVDANAGLHVIPMPDTIVGAPVQMANGSLAIATSAGIVELAPDRSIKQTFPSEGTNVKPMALPHGGLFANGKLMGSDGKLIATIEAPSIAVLRDGTIVALRTKDSGLELTFYSEAGALLSRADLPTEMSPFVNNLWALPNGNVMVGSKSELIVSGPHRGTNIVFNAYTHRGKLVPGASLTIESRDEQIPRADMVTILDANMMLLRIGGKAMDGTKYYDSLFLANPSTLEAIRAIYPDGQTPLRLKDGRWVILNPGRLDFVDGNGKLSSTPIVDPN